jgi:wnt family
MEMLYISPSPNYCEKDLTNGSWGTMGRYCDRTAKGETQFLLVPVELRESILISCRGFFFIVDTREFTWIHV